MVNLYVFNRYKLIELLSRTMYTTFENYINKWCQHLKVGLKLECTPQKTKCNSFSDLLVVYYSRKLIMLQKFILVAKSIKETWAKILIVWIKWLLIRYCRIMSFWDYPTAPKNRSRQSKEKPTKKMAKWELVTYRRPFAIPLEIIRWANDEQ